jgi:hypothetical protein
MWSWKHLKNYYYFISSFVSSKGMKWWIELWSSGSCVGALSQLKQDLFRKTMWFTITKHLFKQLVVRSCSNHTTINELDTAASTAVEGVNFDFVDARETNYSTFATIKIKVYSGTRTIKTFYELTNAGMVLQLWLLITRKCVLTFTRYMYIWFGRKLFYSTVRVSPAGGPGTCTLDIIKLSSVVLTEVHLFVELLYSGYVTRNRCIGQL